MRLSHASVMACRLLAQPWYRNHVFVCTRSIPSLELIGARRGPLPDKTKTPPQPRGLRWSFSKYGAIRRPQRRPLSLLTCRRFDVNDFLSELAQPLIGFAFFIERLLEKFGRVFFAKHVGEGAHGTVAGDFVVLHFLCG